MTRPVVSAPAAAVITRTAPSPEAGGTAGEPCHHRQEPLTGCTIAFLVAPEGVEQVELTEPWRAVHEAGGRPALLSLATGPVRGFHHLDRADVFTADTAVNAVNVTDYHGLVLPGGVANPDTLRLDPAAVAFTAGFFAAGKPVAAICHAPWLLIEADVVRDRRLTSWPSLRTDLRNAGADWVDREVVIDDGLVTSRRPDDLPAFCAALVSEFCHVTHREQGEPPAGDQPGPPLEPPD